MSDTTVPPYIYSEKYKSIYTSWGNRNLITVTPEFQGHALQTTKNKCRKYFVILVNFTNSQSVQQNTQTGSTRTQKHLLIIRKRTITQMWRPVHRECHLIVAK